ncbi:hypothetical protein, partial [Zhenhengia yiwuensis]|uniref:hypothetical protein n=1 Tax=Zhenhengia yiwuensis TaxID=2763666 RepID=UPI002A76389C
MKIEAGNNVFVLDFNGKANEDEKVFLEVAKYMIDKKLGGQPTEECPTEIKPIIVHEVNTPIVQVIQEEQGGCRTVSPHEVKEKEVEAKVVKTTVTNKQPRQKFSSVKEFLEAQERRLVIGACECEKDFHLWIDEPNQKELRFTCKRCEEDKVIHLDDLVPATYKCNECGKQASFW